MKWAWVWVGLMLLSAGCHTMHFDVVDRPHAMVVEQRNDYFLWGLVPQEEVDVSRSCPNGITALREETTFLNGICHLLTLGIWAPQSVSFYCLPAVPAREGAPS